MPLAPNVLQAIYANVAKFKALAGEDFYSDPAGNNVQALYKQLRKMGIEQILWAQPEGENLFYAAFGHVKHELEKEPSKEQLAREREANLKARDRAAGSHQANSSATQETEFSARIRLAKEREAEANTRKQKQTEEFESNARREADASNFAILPTWREIVAADCERIPNEEFKKFSVLQMREYNARLKYAKDYVVAQKATAHPRIAV